MTDLHQILYQFLWEHRFPGQTPEDGAREAMEQLQEMNRKLREENERLRSLPLKERLYEKIHVSVRTLDIFIGCMCVLFVIVVILGMMNS